MSVSFTFFSLFATESGALVYLRCVLAHLNFCAAAILALPSAEMILLPFSPGGRPNLARCAGSATLDPVNNDLAV